MKNADLPQREKYWEELTLEQKVEKLAWAFEMLRSYINSQGEVIQRLENHVHVGDSMFFRQDGPCTPVVWMNINPLSRKKDPN